MITLICEQCQQPYHAKNYMATKSERHFCGMSCYAEWQRVNRTGQRRKRITVSCHTCGTDIEKQPSAVTNRNFCSRQCFGLWRSSPEWCGENNPTWLGGHPEYRGANWKTQCRAARKRDGNTCQSCGKASDNLPVHHKTPFRLFDTYLEANHLDNLVTLCPSCHCKAEAEFWRNNPHLRDPEKYPDIFTVRTCIKCGEEFCANSGAAKVCPKCAACKCKNCGKSFVNRRAARDAKYCSKACRHSHVKQDAIRYTEKACAGCGKTFVSTRKEARFCSQECHLTKDNPRRKFSARRSLAAQE